jgi:hypothetical protein
MSHTLTQLTHKSLIDPILWTRLVTRIVKENEYDINLTERIMDQALGFLQLCARDPDGRYSPSAMVDIGWHTFILYTREYATFCTKMAGRFIHHSPLDEPGASYPTNLLARTTAAMRVRGLTVDEALWDGHVGDCGGHKCYTCTE